MNTLNFERQIVDELIAAEPPAILAYMLELEKTQRLVDGVCNEQDGALEAFAAETEQMRQHYAEAEAAAYKAIAPYHFTDEAAYLHEAERQLAEAMRPPFWLDSDTTVNLPPATQAAIAYGDWNPAEHIPADPSVMSQSGWVCNSRRAAIKAAYEKQLHEEYNALFTKGK